jgi:hypothetical protein
MQDRWQVRGLPPELPELLAVPELLPLLEVPPLPELLDLLPAGAQLPV